MANTNSSLITTLDSTTGASRFVEPQATGGRVRIASGFIEVAGADFDAANDTIILCRLPAQASIKSFEFMSDDQDSGAQSSVDLGVYPAGETTTANAIDADCYKDGATDFRSPITSWSDMRHDSTGAAAAADITTVNQSIWENAGVASDPGPILYDLVLTQMSTVSSTPASFTVAFKINYVID